MATTRSGFSRCGAGGGFAPERRLRRDRLNRVDGPGPPRREARLPAGHAATEEQARLTAGVSMPRTAPTTSPRRRPPSRRRATAIRSSCPCGSTLRPALFNRRCRCSIHLGRAARAAHQAQTSTTEPPCRRRFDCQLGAGPAASAPLPLDHLARDAVAPGQEAIGIAGGRSAGRCRETCQGIPDAAEIPYDPPGKSRMVPDSGGAYVRDGRLWRPRRNRCFRSTWLLRSPGCCC